MIENEYEDDALVTRQKEMLDRGIKHNPYPTLNEHDKINVRGNALALSIEYNRGDTDYAIIKSAEAYANFVLEGTVPDDPQGAETGAGEPTGGTQETTLEPGTTLE